MSIKKGLGRGFDSLIPTDILDETFDPTAGDREQTSELRFIKRTDIEANRDQPRREFETEALEELATSIREHGIVQPIVVTPHNGKYQIVAGERRWRAAELADLDKLPAIVRTLSEQHKLEIALIENVQRKDLNPLEIATAYLKLHQQFNLNYEEIGKRAGKATSTISNFMRLLYLPPAAKEAIVKGQITEGHARQILAIDDAVVQAEFLKKIISEGWSVRKAEQFVVGYKKGDDQDTKRQQALRHTQTETDFTRSLSKRIAMPVRLKTMANGGQVIIEYHSDEELSALESRLS